MLAEELGPGFFEKMAELSEPNAESAKKGMKAMCLDFIIPNCPCKISKIFCDEYMK
jgi:hypothetical protein